MGPSKESFIAQFHALPGKTVKEKQHNLFGLFRAHLSMKDSKTELDSISANLEPVDYLEKIFYIDFLIYFRRFDELYEHFKKGDNITIKKLSKHEWFYHAAYKEADPEEFVNTILPTLSLSLKKKVLRKLPIIEEKCCDKIFDAVKKRYGIFLATDLLSKCSSEKIRDILKHNPITLSQRQLQTLYDKDPDLIFVYFEERSKHDENLKFLTSNTTILIYIAQKNPEMFSELFDIYEFNTMNIGRRTTKKYLTSQKDKVIDKPDVYLKMLNIGVVVRKLGSELKDIFFKHSKLMHFPYWHVLLKHYPKRQQFTIYRTTYDLIHHQKFDENIDKISEEILSIISDQTEREHFAKLKYKNDNNETYLKYVTPNYCFEEYMEKMSHMRYGERVKFVEIATECCILSNDLYNLLKVCDLVAVRLKNDDRRVRESFFFALTKDEHFLDKLTEQHWKFIADILEIVNQNGEWISVTDKVKIKYIEFLVKNEQSIKEFLSKYNDWHNVLMYHSSIHQNSDIFKPVINLLIETGCVDTLKYDAHFEHKFDCSLAYLCQLYNKLNPQDAINVHEHPRILKSIRVYLEKVDRSSFVPLEYKLGIEYIICRPSSSQELNELKNLYFKFFNTFGSTSGLMWFLKYEPETFQNNITHLLDNFSLSWTVHSIQFWRYIKKYSSMGFDRKIVDTCKQKMEEEEVQNRSELAKALVVLETLDSYVEFLESYIPISDKADLTDKNIKRLYNVQIHLIELAHLADSPAKLLPVILQFCKGDYLKHALKSLYSCMCRIPENETKYFIDELNKSKAISVKKHALHLCCLVCDKKTAKNCLKSVDVSSLVPALKYFAKNPSDRLWDTIATELTNIEKKDLHVCHALLDLSLPEGSSSKFVEVLWKLLDRHEDTDIKKKLITKIGKNTAKNLNSAFAFKVMNDCLFKYAESDALVATIFIYLHDNDKFTILRKILQKLQENEFSESKTCREARKNLNKFVVTIFNTYMKSEETDQKFVTDLLMLFKNIFSLPEVFEECIIILLMAFKEGTVENCCRFVLEFNYRVARNYSKYGVTLFGKTIKDFGFKHAFTTDSEQIRLCHALFSMRKSFDDELVILILLPKTTPEDTEHFLLFDEILSTLSHSSDNVVQLQYNLYLKANS